MILIPLKFTLSLNAFVKKVEFCSRSFVLFCQLNTLRMSVPYVNNIDCLSSVEFDPEKTKMKDVFAKFGVDANTQSFTGHALALHLNDKYVLNM